MKSSFCFGPDWSVVQGIDLGITQIAHKSDEGETVVVWNFPLDITFRSFTAFGWPRLCISVYRIDEWGRDVVQGYGQLALPTVPGAQTKYVRIFRPIAKSWFAQATSWVFGSQPEFFDSKFVAQAENRHGTFEEGGGGGRVGERRKRMRGRSMKKGEERAERSGERECVCAGGERERERDRDRDRDRQVDRQVLE